MLMKLTVISPDCRQNEKNLGLVVADERGFADRKTCTTKHSAPQIMIVAIGVRVLQQTH